MNRAYLLTGGNMGNRQQNLARAIELINKDCGRIVKKSSLFETAAWGKTNQPAFLNQALELHTPLRPTNLLQCVLKVENKMGRIRDERYGPRIIDIDILLFNNEIYNDQGPGTILTIPHPQMQNRKFALLPLAEIAPGFIHPVFHKSIHQLLQECGDKLDVKKIAD